MTNNTNTILLTESGDLEVYEGNRPNRKERYLAYIAWLSTKKVVKIKYSEFVKLTNYLHNEKTGFTYPIDVSDIVTLKEEQGKYFPVLWGYFTPPPVDKEEETQEKLLIDLIEMHKCGFFSYEILQQFKIKRNKI